MEPVAPVLPVTPIAPTEPLTPVLPVAPAFPVVTETEAELQFSLSVRSQWTLEHSIAVVKWFKINPTIKSPELGELGKGRPPRDTRHVRLVVSDDRNHAFQRIYESNSLNSKSNKNQKVINSEHFGCVVHNNNIIAHGCP